MDLDRDFAQWAADYLSGKLKGEDKQAFEEELQHNQKLKEEFYLQKQTNEMIESHFSMKNEKALWESYQSLAAEMPSLSEEENRRKGRVIFWKRTALFAATLFILSTVSFSYLLAQSSNRIAKYGIENSQLIESERSGNSIEGTNETTSIIQLKEKIKIEHLLTDRIKLAALYLNEENYQEAAKVLEQAKMQAIQEGNPMQTQLDWDLATAYIGDENYEQAIESYQNLVDAYKKNAKLSDKDKKLVKKAKHYLVVLKTKKALHLKN